VDVPDAAELVAANSDVRIGTARVGVVRAVTPMPGEDGRPPYARLQLGLEPSVGPLPVDTVVEVRPRSALGAKYVDVSPGTSERTIAANGVLPISQALPATELDAALEIFDQPTRRLLQTAIINLGDGFAGRGSAINEAISAARRIQAPAMRVTETFADPSANLSGTIRATAAVTGAVGPVAGSLGSLIDNAAVTAGAVNDAGDEFAAGFEQLVPTEDLALRVIRQTSPVLEDAAAIARSVRPGTRALPAAARKAADVVDAVLPVMKQTPPVASDATKAFGALEDLAGDELVDPVFGQLTRTVNAVGSLMEVLGVGQLNCNIAGTFAHNVASVFGSGDRNGTWTTMVLILDVSKIFPAKRAAANLHVNPYPHEDANECESGNEPYDPTSNNFGNPPGPESEKFHMTEPPADAWKRGQQAGLIAGTEEDR
jgi:ABC-type transporter Mla subunit MlaD